MCKTLVYVSELKYENIINIQLKYGKNYVSELKIY